MTISQYIVDLFKNYEPMEIETNHLPEGADCNGLFKSPGRTVKNYADASCEITESYQFFARQSDISDAERKESDEWLEDFCYWVDDFPYVFNFPALDGNRTVTGISVSGGPAPMEYEDGQIIYQISLSITYMREREV